MLDEAKPHVIDRKGWPPGPWDAEPEDREEWRHKGLPCLIVRNDMGSWCGYVAVPPGHPFHGMGYEKVETANVEVHGGLTFAAGCTEGSRICHVPEPGEPDDVWWLGFDCNHAWDLAPAMLALACNLGRAFPMPEAIYRNRAYAKAEVESLADQVIARAG